jgi:hypothetical protein
MANYRPDRGGGGNFTPIVVPYAASITLDLSVASRPLFEITLTGSLTLENPVSGVAGQEFGVVFRQASGGGHSVAYGSKFKGSSDTSIADAAPASGLGTRSYAGFVVNATDDTIDFLAPNRGYS